MQVGTSKAWIGGFGEVCPFGLVSDGKALVASAITDKGIATENDATFQTMSDNIRSIVGTATNFPKTKHVWKKILPNSYWRLKQYFTCNIEVDDRDYLNSRDGYYWSYHKQNGTGSGYTISADGSTITLTGIANNVDPRALAGRYCFLSQYTCTTHGLNLVDTSKKSGTVIAQFNRYLDTVTHDTVTGQGYYGSAKYSATLYNTEYYTDLSNFIEYVIGDSNAYPNNATASDGYYYILVF